MGKTETVATFLRIEAHLLIPGYRAMYTLVLGERLNGIQEVSGSIPLISTKGLESNDSRPFSLDLYDFD